MGPEVCVVTWQGGETPWYCTGLGWAGTFYLISTTENWLAVGSGSPGTRKLETTIAGPSVIILTIFVAAPIMNVWLDILTYQKCCGVWHNK